jgi:glucose-6-phosphate-specific signal transduction histidine kinase
VRCRESKKNYLLTISNEVTGYGLPFVEGSGIHGMRYHIEEVGGTLRALSSMDFTIDAVVPKKETT